MINTLSLPPKSKICIISARRYGDAIIHASLANQAAQNRPDLTWIIWTKPEFISLFQMMGFSHIISSEFPIAGGSSLFVKNFGVNFLQAISQLRRKNLNASVDFVGDFREALFGWMISGKNHRSPRWHPSHWMQSLIWNTRVPTVHYINISQSQDRIYDVIADLLTHVTGINQEKIHQLATISKPLSIAFHPFSSQEFKSWPKENWEKICALLNQNNITPIILCSKNEEVKAHDLFQSKLIFKKIIATHSLDDLISHIKSIDLLVGVDSFLVHCAAAFGKRTVVINAGNLPKWWHPPNATVIGQSGGCEHYPCANNPRCLLSIDESKCIKSISPTQVMNAIADALTQ